MSRAFEPTLTEKMYINGRVVEVDGRKKVEQQNISDDKRMQNYMKERARSIIQKRETE